MLSYSITDIPCNDLHLRFGREVEPIVIKDIPTHVTKEGTNNQVEIPICTTISILEDVETPNETPSETHIKNNHIQFFGNPPYSKQLSLQGA